VVIVQNILTVFVVLLGVVMIGLVMMQTPKNEGFGGGVTDNTVGGFRGKAGYDEMLSQYTRYIAVGWFVCAFILAVVGEFAHR
jgi:protein translocase SecG subunit